MDIRRFEPADRVAVLRLLETTGLPISDLVGGSFTHFIVCERAGEIVGTAALQPYGGFALLRSVAVREDCRGLGIADALVRTGEAGARGAGFQALYLLTTTAAPYFALRGWRETDRAAAPDEVRATAEFFQLCPSSSTCMTKALS